jgi:hypothetical protein
VKVGNLTMWRTTGEAAERAMPAESITAAEWNFVVGVDAALFERLDQMPHRLGHLVHRMAQGIRTSANEVYVLDFVSSKSGVLTARSKRLDRETRLDRQTTCLFLRGRDVKRYRLVPSGKIVIMPYAVEGGRARLIAEKEMVQRFPNTFRYLSENKAYLEQRERGRMRGAGWYGYIYPKNIDVMSASKILVPDIADGPSFALDQAGEYALTSGYAITLRPEAAESLKYVLGLLNSRLLDFHLRRASTTMRGGFFRYFTQFIERLPVPSIDFSDPPDKARHDRMVELVERMLEVHKKLAAAKTAHEKTVLQREIETTDRQIDQLVYELYGLTKDEIKIVEEGIK